MEQYWPNEWSSVAFIVSSALICSCTSSYSYSTWVRTRCCSRNYSNHDLNNNRKKDDQTYMSAKGLLYWFSLFFKSYVVPSYTTTVLRHDKFSQVRSGWNTVEVKLKSIVLSFDLRNCIIVSQWWFVGGGTQQGRLVVWLLTDQQTKWLNETLQPGWNRTKNKLKHAKIIHNLYAE